MSGTHTCMGPKLIMYVILELMGMISIAMIPTCPSNESLPSSALRSARNFMYG